MKIGIITQFDCVLDCNGSKYTMKKNISRIELEIFSDEECILLFYPTSDARLLSYTAQLKIENGKLLSACPHVKKVEDNLGDAELEFLPFRLFCAKIKKVFKGSFAGFDIKVFSADKNFVCFDDGTEVFFAEFDGKIKSCNFLTVSNFPAVFVKMHERSKLFVFRSENETIDSFDGQIEIDDDMLSVTDEKNDFAKHAKKTEYKYENGQLVTLSEELLYAGGKPQITSNAKIIPLAFFEAVSEKNFLLAKEYLSGDLASRVTMEMLEDYFGDFDKVRPYNFQADKGYFVSVVKGGKSKIFRIRIQNAKIDEIELYNFR